MDLITVWEKYYIFGGSLENKKICNPKNIRNTQITLGNDLTRKYASLCGKDCSSVVLSGEQKRTLPSNGHSAR